MSWMVVDALEPAADGVLTVTLRDPDGAELPRWEPGAHIDVELGMTDRTEPGLPHADGRLGSGVVRQYSLCGEPADRRAWRIAVLREPESRGGSRHVHERLTVGAKLRVDGPRNHFPLLDATEYLFIAGGIGITPIVAMIEATEASGRPWSLLYGGRRRASMAFLDRLAGYGDRVSIRPQDETGLLDLGVLPAQPTAGTLVYCCGPEPLLAAVEQRCAGWPAGALQVERFTARPCDTSADTGFDVELAQTGRVVTVAPGVSILRALETAGVAVLSSCQEGTCGTCETAVLRGRVEHRDSVLTEAERNAGDLMMICVSRSRDPLLVLDL
jgi:ferredoxin-NADP reductase